MSLFSLSEQMWLVDILSWLPLSVGVVFALASSSTARLLRPLDALLDELTHVAENHLAALEEHGVVLPMARQPVRPVYVLDLHLAPHGLHTLCRRYYGLSLANSGDLGGILTLAGTSFTRWPVAMNCVGPAADPTLTAAMHWLQSSLCMQLWLPDVRIPSIPAAWSHLFPFGTALYRHWPVAGAEGDVLALYLVHGNLGIVLLFFEADSSTAHASNEGSVWELSDSNSDSEGPWLVG